MWSVCRFVRQKSKFIGRAIKIDSIDHAKSLLKEVKKLEPKATHQIYAFRCAQGDECRNDGEGNAGERLLQMLKHQQAQNTLVVVHRYFGGVQMGPSRFRAIDEAGLNAVLEISGNNK